MPHKTLCLVSGKEISIFPQSPEESYTEILAWLFNKHIVFFFFFPFVIHFEVTLEMKDSFPWVTKDFWFPCLAPTSLPHYLDFLTTQQNFHL